MEVIIHPTPKKGDAATTRITQRMLRGSKKTVILMRLITMLISGVIFGEAVLLLVVMNQMHGNQAFWFLGGLYLLLILFFLRRQSIKAMTKLRYRPEGYLLSPVRYVIEEDALVVYKRETIVRYGWKDFEDVEKVREFILIYLDRGYGIYMTREDFTDDRHFEGFFEGLKARIKGTVPKKLTAPSTGSSLSPL